MKRVLLIFLSFTLLSSIISAEIIITQQPDSVYNLGDIVNLPMKITSLTETTDFLKISLICNGIETEVHKEYILLEIGEEAELIIKIPLITSFTSRDAGKCVIKSVLGTDNILSDEFELLNNIEISLEETAIEINPGDNLIIKGEAKKGTGVGAKGIMEAFLIKDYEEKLKFSDTISKGYFNLNLTIPKNFPSGDYLLRLNAYEKDIEGQITNQGEINTGITINQIPTSLEIALENQKIESGTSAKIRVILHDQTGEKISSITTLKIFNDKNKLILEKELNTDEVYEHEIIYNQKPEEWKLTAISEGVEGASYLEILPTAKVETILINKTLLVKNIGNIPYNKSIPIKIGDNTINIETSLGVGQEQKYILSAPDGEYEVEFAGQTQNVMLTGASIGIKEVGGSFIQYPLVWMFIIGILGFVSYIFFKKGYNKTFIGYITRKKGESKEVKGTPIRKDSLVKSNNKAELSLSIKGVKQGISLICLKIKNLKEIESKKGDIEETLQQIVTSAEENKALTYENQENIFFLFVPLKTKTFKNEKTAIQTAQTIKRILDHSNKLFKDKIDYGIALNHGSIVVKQESDSFKFMSLGTLMSEARKISAESKGEVLLSEEIKDKAATEIKTEKLQNSKTPVYKIKELKEDNVENQKFISNFIKRLESHK